MNTTFPTRIFSDREIKLQWREVGERIEEDVDDAPGAIAQRGRAQDRQHQVEAFASDVSAEGLAEVLLVVGKARFGGDVEQAEHADGGVNEKADRKSTRLNSSH